MSAINYPRVGIDQWAIDPSLGNLTGLPPATLDRWRAFHRRLGRAHRDRLSGWSNRFILAYPSSEDIEKLFGSSSGLGEIAAATIFDPGAELVDAQEAEDLLLRDNDRSFIAGRINEDEAQTFGSDEPILPVLDDMPDETIFFRFLGAAVRAPRDRDVVTDEDIRLTASDPTGSFWGVGEPPRTEAEFRSRYAIKPVWNGDGVYIMTTAGDLKSRFPGQWAKVVATGAVGSVGAQPALRDEAGMSPLGRRYILRGGGRQLFVPRGTIDLNEGSNQPWDDLFVSSAWNAKRT